MKSKNLFVAVVAIALVLCCAGCGQKSAPAPAETTAQQIQEPIVGTWKAVSFSLWLDREENAEVLEGEALKETFGEVYYKFDADGSATITSGSITQGSWKNTAPNTYLLTYPVDTSKGTEEVMLVVSGDTMTGTSGKKVGIGSAYTFERSK